jgi:hypothetical protein
MNEGYIQLRRSEIDGSFFGPGKYCARMAWIDLRICASWQDEKVYRDDRMLHLKMGQLATSTSELGRRWNWQRPTVKNFIDKLVEADKLRIERKGKVLVVTIASEYLGKIESLDESQAGYDQQYDHQNNHQNDQSLYIREEETSKTNPLTPLKKGGYLLGGIKRIREFRKIQDS